MIIHKINSKDFFQYFPDVVLNYDRWADCLDYCLENYDDTFTITAENVWLSACRYYSSLAEIYHILFVDKKINDYINVRGKSVQPGLKRVMLLEYLDPHEIKVVEFKDKKFYDFQDKNSKINKTEIGYEIRDFSWENELTNRLTKQPLNCIFKGNNLYINNIHIFTKKDTWSLVYK